MNSSEDSAELNRLRRELTWRFKAHPPSTWSPALLSVVINAIDLQFGGDPPPTWWTKAAAGVRLVWVHSLGTA